MQLYLIAGEKRQPKRPPRCTKEIPESNSPSSPFVALVVYDFAGGLSFRLRHSTNLLQLTPPVQFFDKVSRIAPSRLDLDEEFEKHLCPHHLLYIEPGRGSNLLQHLAAFAQ
jgi:hypothetical protein